MLNFYANPLSPHASKVHYLLEEAGINYKYHMVDLRSPAAKAELTKINPFGKVPAIELNGFCLGESNAIARYVLDRHHQNSLYPVNLEERAQVDMVYEFVQAHVNRWLNSLVWNLAVAPKMGLSPDAKAISEAHAQLPIGLGRLESWLSGRNYLAGPSFTLADIALLPTLAEHRNAQISLADYPQLHAWLDRVSTRPAWKKYQADHLARVEASTKVAR